MPKNKVIKPKAVAAVVNLIRGWSSDEAFTWEAVCRSSEPFVGYQPTRQALSSKGPIAEAYAARKKGQQVEPDRRQSRPANLAAASATIDRLRAENAELRLVNDRLKQRFVTWLYNASLVDLTPEKLDRVPNADEVVAEVVQEVETRLGARLPVIDREPSRGAVVPKKGLRSLT